MEYYPRKTLFSMREYYRDHIQNNLHELRQDLCCPASFDQKNKKGKLKII